MEEYKNGKIERVLENDQIDQFISLDYDLLLVNIVDRTNAAVIIDKATQADIPVVFFNREPVREDIFRSDQIYYEGSDAKQSAILQADVIADALEKDRSKIDRNGDSVIQFAMLEGESGSSTVCSTFSFKREATFAAEEAVSLILS